MKVLADVNVSRRVVERLQQRGIEIVRASDLIDARSPDEEVVALARRMGAILVSHDQDISAILAVSGAASPSLVNLRIANLGVEATTGLIAKVLAETEADLRTGAIVTVDDAGVRVHRLPV